MREKLPEMLTFAQELAWHAGKVTLRYFQTGVTPDRKADDSPVTVADREAERVMRAMISDRYPTHAVIGEEAGASGDDDADWQWILDPIDGTKSFVRGVPLYGVLVGLLYQGAAVVGAINIPAQGEMVAAAQGYGCHWNGRACRVSSVASLREGLLVSTVEGHDFARYGRGAAYDALRGEAGMFRTWGDCYGYVLVATGRAEAMVDPRMSVWDTAALLPVLQEAGGTLTDWQGVARIDGGEAIGSNGRVLEDILAVTQGAA